MTPGQEALAEIARLEAAAFYGRPVAREPAVDVNDIDAQIDRATVARMEAKYATAVIKLRRAV